MGREGGGAGALGNRHVVERDRRGVGRVVDGDQGGVGGVERLVIAAGRAADRNAVALVVDVGVVALDREGRGDAAGCADRNGDAGAVAPTTVGERGVARGR